MASVQAVMAIPVTTMPLVNYITFQKGPTEPKYTDLLLHLRL